MAERPVFFISNNVVRKKHIEFEWFTGFSVSQKRKSIDSLHFAIRRQYPEACLLEVSTKSTVLLGNKLSAFNLKIDGYYLESVFQSSKVFEKGGPFIDLLKVSPKDAKRDDRLRGSGRLQAFEYNEQKWPLEPKTVFYDYLYYQAVRNNLTTDEIAEFKKYNYFTDIEFNPNKSINTQARSACLVRLILEMYGELMEIRDMDEFIRLHKRFIKGQ